MLLKHAQHTNSEAWCAGHGALLTQNALDCALKGFAKESEKATHECQKAFCSEGARITHALPYTGVIEDCCNERQCCLNS